MASPKGDTASLVLRPDNLSSWLAFGLARFARGWCLLKRRARPQGSDRPLSAKGAKTGALAGSRPKRHNVPSINPQKSRLSLCSTKASRSTLVCDQLT